MPFFAVLDTNFEVAIPAQFMYNERRKEAVSKRITVFISQQRLADGTQKTL